MSSETKVVRPSDSPARSRTNPLHRPTRPSPGLVAPTGKHVEPAGVRHETLRRRRGPDCCKLAYILYQMARTHPVERTLKDFRPRAGELAVTGGPQSVVVPFQKRKSFANFVFGFPADRQVGVACLTRTLRRRISSSEAAECGGHGFCSPQRRGLISLRERRLAALRAGASDRLRWRWTGVMGRPNQNT